MINHVFNTRISLLVLGVLGYSVSYASEKSTTYELDISAGFLYDSNVSLDEIDLTSRRGDQATIIRAGVSVDHQFSDKIDGSVGYSISDKSYDEFSEFDLRTGLLSASIDGKVADKTKLGLQLNHADSQLNGDDYLQLTKVSPNLSWFLSKSQYLRISIDYTDKSFDGRPTRDAEDVGLGVDWYYFLNSTKNYFVFGYDFNQEDAIDNAFDFSGNTFKFSWINKPEFIGLNSKFRLGFRYEIRDYDDPISGDGVTSRSDDRLRLFSKFEITPVKNVVVELEYEYSDFESTEDVFTYDQDILLLKVGLKI